MVGSSDLCSFVFRSDADPLPLIAEVSLSAQLFDIPLPSGATEEPPQRELLKNAEVSISEAMETLKAMNAPPRLCGKILEDNEACFRCLVNNDHVLQYRQMYY